MSLIEQRNRFLSFAFAAADVLIETDLEGLTCYAAGATATLGEPSIETVGINFAQRLDRTSRPIVTALMRGLKPGRRVGPVRVAVGGREVQLSAWLLGDDEKIRWTMSYAALTAPAELDPQAFARNAQNAITTARKSGAPMVMSVLQIDGIEDIDRLIGAQRAGMLRQAIAAECSITVSDDGVAKQVDAARTALIHPASADLKSLRTDIEDLLHDNALKNTRVRIDSIPDAPELEPEIAIQAFLHAVNMAADSANVLDVQSLQKVAAEMMEETRKRMNEIRATIAGRVIEPHAQPIVNLETGKIEHYELLLRLPGGQPVSESVDFAESTGLIYEIDMAMVEIGANFLRDDFDRPALAVNLSGKSLENPAWGKKFLQVLADLRIDRSRLRFELTETATVRNVKAANAVIQKIRERGHKVCLDDFGAGAAGFQYLRDFPADIVKIDGSYVRQPQLGERDLAILKGMVSLCRELKVDTVAEMIETEQRAKQMLALGVIYGQGYYFGKPIPLKVLTDPRRKPSRAA
ncbi:EAL domain-containing protein [uncultured Maricaulis sp.]|uniref:EAL domain-containing protein n=1 Tax=uncultured Maricaulis sp. TaxID=174710 RepID=UPI0030D8BD77|tara:strand:+ start:21107 stop:22672 length:1566 start_codon:yes stop_codon:yes gene_type:complete